MLEILLTKCLLVVCRIGFGYLKGGMKNMELHAFFKSIDWDNVYHKKDTSLIRPKV